MENIDWKNLPFGYMKTNYNIRCYYRDGKWGELEVSSSEIINMHISATCMHYGQEIFEGLKAFKGEDGQIRVFRWQENAKRLRESAHGLLMAEVPEKTFEEAIFSAIKLNLEYVPTYESGASLYLRPFEVGTGAKLGVQPSDEYLFIVFVSPVGPYFKTGFTPTDMVITRDYDRAAPLGTGKYKCGGNYAASLMSGYKAKKQGYTAVVYLDAKEKKYIDECGPANFFGIKNNTYITPESTSILKSITNDSLQKLALEMGMKVERRKILVEELETFEEVGACGTAAVISPVRSIVDEQSGKTFYYGETPGPISSVLYKKLKEIQYGDQPDNYGWVTIVK